jgi:hypothetical protein
MSTELAELVAGREMDAQIHERLFGVPVVGWCTCAWVDGERSAHPESEDPAGWSCYAERGPVFVEHCCCEHAALDETRYFGHVSSCLGVVPPYSTDIAAAWQVVEHFTAREYGKVRVSTSYYHGYHAHICWGPGVDGEGSSPEGVYGGTAPEAICRAALAAVSRLPG